VTAATSSANAARPEVAHRDRLAVLDGWRACSILMVIAGHWLPLGPKWLELNAAVAAGGMAIFFTLSGFLITRFLLDRPEVGSFLVRRLLRIVPLAWAAMLGLALVNGWSAMSGLLPPNLGFVSNLPPARLLPGGEHLWSLCVEMQFYLGIALLVALAGRRGLFALPFLALAVTAARIVAGEPLSIVTWHRVDEILAGATVALVYSGAFGPTLQRLFAATNFYLAAAAAMVAVYFFNSPLAYARPYGVAWMVGVTLWHAPAWLRWLLESRPAAYIAEISYALYVFHVMFAHGWLGSGGTLEKYAKRPLLAAVTWAAAHLSTFYFEARFIALARHLTARRERHPLTAI
jgi:peptidoglycan/LPS O-acetylase OafA/YrhL